MAGESPTLGAGEVAGSAASSFEAWYKANYRSVVRALVVATGDTELAVESAADGFAKAMARWGRVGEMASPVGWTFTVALNVARRRLRRRRVEQTLWRHTTHAPPADHEAVELWDAVRRLTPRQRTAVALHYVADLPQREVAAAMGVSEGTVAATLHEARRRLARSLGGDLSRRERHGG